MPLERLGWVRVRFRGLLTIAGLVLSLGLAVASAAVLINNISDPLGGWLWAASLLILVLSLLNMRASNSIKATNGDDLLNPERDFFWAGVARMPFVLEAALVGLILGVALALRLYNLEYLPGVEQDEAMRALYAREIIDGNQATLFGQGWYWVPNLYFYLMTFTMRLFGDEIMLGPRMLSVISSAVTVFYIYKIGRLLWGARVGLIAGAMLAISPLALQFGRIAGENTPTGTLWAVGFFYCFMALRYRRWLDWALAGIFWGFSLYFYAAGKLIIPMLAAVILYCLVRWRLAFFKRYALGFALLCVSFLLVFMPYAIFSSKDNWNGFSGRAREGSILAPQHQANVFARYGIPYDPATANEQSLEGIVMSNPMGWSFVLLNQMRIATEAIYMRADSWGFYSITEHNGSMMTPLWALLTLLGLGYATWKLWDPRYGLAGIWFWSGLLGVAVMADLPNMVRIGGAWSVVMLFPATLIDRIASASWPLSANFARRWASVPAVVLLVYLAVQSYREYFTYYPTTCYQCVHTLHARYMKGLGDEYVGYLLTVGEHGVTSFSQQARQYLAPKTQGMDLAVPAEHLPITDHDKGAAYLIGPVNRQYLPIIKLFYPDGMQEQLVGPDGFEYFVSYKVTAEQVDALRRVRATYTFPGGKSISRDEPNLGTTPKEDTWSAPEGLAYPAKASWEGGLVAPAYGLYTFHVSEGTELEIDGKTVVNNASAGTGEVVLASGMHQIRVSGTLDNKTAKIELRWSSGGSSPVAVPRRYLFNGPTGGLSAEVGPYTDVDVLSGDQPFGGKTTTSRRSDPFLGLLEAAASLGTEPFAMRWRGTLDVPVAGTYLFETRSNGPSRLLIDGQEVTRTEPQDRPTVGNGSIELNAGPHSIEVRYAWKAGQALMELYWTPPQGERSIVPPTVLTPEARSWTKTEVPAAPSLSLTVVNNVSERLQPDLVVGSDAGFNLPRGLDVDADGNIYVGDTGNNRVVVLSPEGKLLRTWGKKPENPQGNTVPQPGSFGHISDLAVTADGTVYVLENMGRIQVFTRDGILKRTIGPEGLQLYAPNGIDVDQTGLIYVGDTGGSRVLEIVAIEDEITTKDYRGDTSSEQKSGRLDQPIDATVIQKQDSLRVFTIDLSNRILEMGADGLLVGEWPTHVGRGTGGGKLASSPDGTRIYMTNSDTKKVAVLDLTRGTLSYFGEPGRESGQFLAPSGLAVGIDGRVYVLDYLQGTVQIFTIP